jgi:uncharacterized protein
MSKNTVCILLRDAFDLISPGGTISFAFQGGEPTVAGLDYFRFFVKTAGEMCPNGVNIMYSIQTNGTLIDDSWAQFFSEHNFLVGISLDGFKEAHDINRVYPKGNGTWNTVVKSLGILRKYNVEVNALCVVTKRLARSAENAYSSLKKLGLEYMQFIACLDPIEKPRGCETYSLTPDTYSKFLKRLFDLWYHDWETGSYHSIRLFDDYVHILLGDAASTCSTCGSCGVYFVIESDGFVYPCDFFTTDKWKMGRLGDVPLSELLSTKTENFLSFDKEKPLECNLCKWKYICNGGCKNDWIHFDDGAKNYYCSTFKELFEYIVPRLNIIAGEERLARKKMGYGTQKG